MDILYPCCAGLDVHKKTVVACRVFKQATGEQVVEVRTFATLTSDLLLLSDWLRAGGITHVAIESTGVYRQPVYNLLEPDFAMLLVNPRHFHNVPGRKTDANDAEWLAELLQVGLLKPSFVPPPAQRQLRELVRYRSTLIRERNAVQPYPEAAGRSQHQVRFRSDRCVERLGPLHARSAGRRRTRSDAACGVGQGPSAQ